MDAPRPSRSASLLPEQWSSRSGGLHRGRLSRAAPCRSRRRGEEEEFSGAADEVEDSMASEDGVEGGAGVAVAFGHFLDLVQETGRSQGAKSRAKQVRRVVLSRRSWFAPTTRCKCENCRHHRDRRGQFLHCRQSVAWDTRSTVLARLSGTEEGIVRAGGPMERYRWQRRGVRR